jgi:hypothetical protein
MNRSNAAAIFISVTTAAAGAMPLAPVDRTKLKHRQNCTPVRRRISSGAVQWMPQQLRAWYGPCLPAGISRRAGRRLPRQRALSPFLDLVRQYRAPSRGLLLVLIARRS